jgi:hypothetical protein
MAADFPYQKITGQSSREDATAYIHVNVQSEYIPIDEIALTHAIEQWLLDNVPDIVSTSAERHEQVYTVTTIPPAGS